jgi:carbonic anhydrase
MRRSAILAFVFSLSLAAQEPAPPAAPPVPNKLAGDQLWAALLAGNKVFVAGKLSWENLKSEREQLKDGQVPPVTVLSCSDSRVPPELIFNQSLGALYVVRQAGAVTDDFGVASIEFAITQGWTGLIVVLGHSECGAVKAALGGNDPATQPLGALARRLRASFIGIPYDSRDANNVKRAVETNARASAAHLLSSSKIIRDAVITEVVKIVPAYYDLATGEVRKLV